MVSILQWDFHEEALISQQISSEISSEICGLVAYKGLYLLCLHMHSTAHHREACKLSETRMDKHGLRNDGGVRCVKCKGASHQVFDDAGPCQSRGIWSIGAVGRCLSRQLAESKPLTLECRSLVLVAAPRVGDPLKPGLQYPAPLLSAKGTRSLHLCII